MPSCPATWSTVTRPAVRLTRSRARAEARAVGARAALTPRGDGGGETAGGGRGAPCVRQRPEQRPGQARRCVHQLVLGVGVLVRHQVEQERGPLQLEADRRDLVPRAEGEDMGPGLGSDDDQPRIHRPAGRIPAAGQGEVQRRIGEHAVHRPVPRRQLIGGAMSPQRLGVLRELGWRVVLAVAADRVPQAAGRGIGMVHR